MATGSLPSGDLLDDLCIRFILNVPQEDLQYVILLCLNPYF
jgi:hypothetical protein